MATEAFREVAEENTEKDNDSGCCPVSGVLLLGFFGKETKIQIDGREEWEMCRTYLVKKVKLLLGYTHSLVYPPPSPKVYLIAM